MDLQELNDDLPLKTKLKNFHESVEKIQKVIDVAIKADTSKFSLKDKIDFDLFMVYALNSLFWIYMRTKGEDPSNHDVKNQLGRIKDYMVKAKKAHERLTIRPTIDQAAAKRFVKHGINHKKKPDDSQSPNKKIKFND